MLLNSCPFCEHVNPADSKFCNGCGGALHLVPCPRCGAVSDVTAISCYQCHSLLPGHGTDELDSAQAAAEVPRPLPRPRSRVIIGTAILAAITVLGYYSYRQLSLVGAPQPPVTSSETSGRGGSTGAGVIHRDAAAGDTAAGDTALGKADDSAGLASPATSPPEPAKSPAAKAAAAPIARSKAINEGRASERGPSRPEACTDAAATLGLCTRPEVTAVREAGQQEPPRQAPPRQEACTEAGATLGLCTPTPTTARP